MARCVEDACAVAHHRPCIRVRWSSSKAPPAWAAAPAVFVQRDVGDEAQPPLVDADQRRAVARQLAANAQHGAVAAHHHARSLAAPMAGHVEGGVARHAGDGGGALLEAHLAALRVPGKSPISATSSRRDSTGLPVRFVVLADQGDVRELGLIGKLHH
jgi:hypothetical protein